MSVEGPDESPRPRRDQRRRRANVEGGRQFRHEVKVSPEEEGALLRLALAQNVTVPRLLVESALATETGQTVTERREVLAELFAVHRLLAVNSNNVNQIARATNATHEVQPATVQTLAKLREVADRVDQVIERLSLP